MKVQKSAKKLELLALTVLAICYASVLFGLKDFDPMGHTPSPALDIGLSIAAIGPLLSVYPILAYLFLSDRQVSGMTGLILLLLVPHLLLLLAVVRFFVFEP